MTKHFQRFQLPLVIEKEQVFTENWNKPNGTGNIDPANFSPYPKNPIIAKFFKEIGWVDELGSGVRNTYKFSELYTPGVTPTFIEDDVFKIIVPLIEKSPEKTREKTREKIITIIEENKNITASELADMVDISIKGVEYQISKLKKEGTLNRIGSDKSGYWEVVKK